MMLEGDGLREEGERVLVGMEEKLPHLRTEAEQWVSLPLSQHPMFWHGIPTLHHKDAAMTEQLKEKIMKKVKTFKGEQQPR